MENSENSRNSSVYEESKNSEEKSDLAGTYFLMLFDRIMKKFQRKKEKALSAIVSAKNDSQFIIG